MADNQDRGRRRPRTPEPKERRGHLRAPQEEPLPKIPKPSSSRAPSEASTSSRGGTTGPSSTNRDPRVNPRSRNDEYEIVKTRPEGVVTQGRQGTPINLQTNYFRLTTTPKWQIVHYHVDFEPDIEMVRVRRGILSEHSRILGSGFIFDGKQLFSTVKLDKNPTVLAGTSKSGIDYKITLKFVGLVSNVESRFLQVLNLILRRSMKGLKLELVGRNLFDPHAKIELREHRIELWPGYETSIRQHEKSILLCTEIKHKVMRTETVYDILRRSSANPSRHQEEFRHNVLGLVVLTDYNNKTYRVNDVDFSQTPRSTFNMKGKEVSFVDYYLTKYNIRIRDQNQPLLVSKNKDKAMKTNASDIVILIPELCRVTGLNDSMRTNFQLMAAMGRDTRMNPDRRIERLRTFNRRLLNTQDSVKVLKDWNMQLESTLTEVKGRIIEPQRIVFKQTKVQAGDNADWSSSFRNAQMFTSPNDGLNRWAVIAPERSGRDLSTLLNTLYRAAGGMGFHIRPPREQLIYNDRTSSYISALDDCANQDPKLILCLVPNNNEERYSSIKKRGCVERAVPTQVVTSKTAGHRSLMSIATKIVIQLNCKLGYTPWMIEVPLSGLMTVGFDIAKCSRDRSKAYGALVASMDLQHNSTYYSTVAECSAHDVLSNNLWPMFVKALRQYHREHNSLPSRILFYRDGVGSGSLKQLFEYEVKEITEKLTQEYQRAQSEHPPQLAYVVVTKSSNTRFFQGNRNPPCGTVVDDVVTLPERYDFYLVSQTVRQGTVSPTSYNVLYSNIGLDPDKMQKLTYKMCHLYYNWAGTTRVPSVCQYAKKLATLVATNLHVIPHNALEKKFYYL